MKRLEKEFVIPYAKQIATRLGIPTDVINERTISVFWHNEKHNFLAEYSPYEFKIVLRTMSEQRISRLLEHELVHMQRHLRRTAHYTADRLKAGRMSDSEWEKQSPYIARFKNLWLAQVGTSTYRASNHLISDNRTEKRTQLSKASKGQFKKLLSAAASEFTNNQIFSGNIAAVNQWLAKQSVPQKLLSELGEEATIESEILAELFHYRVMLNLSSISQSIIDDPSNAALANYLNNRAQKLLDWQKSAKNKRRKLSENPEFLHLTRDASLDVTAMRGETIDYSVSNEEASASHFASSQNYRQSLSEAADGMAAEKNASVREEALSHFKYRVLLRKIFNEYSKAVSTSGKTANAHWTAAKKHAHDLLDTPFSRNENKLVTLYRLKQAGLLTDEEFRTFKKTPPEDRPYNLSELGYIKKGEIIFSKLRELSDSDKQLINKLDLRDYQIADSDLAYLAGLNKLQHLWLCNCGITDHGLINLQTLTDLKMLDLEGNQITNVGLSHLSGLTNLTSLSLSCEAITEAGLDSLQGMNNLRSLSLPVTAYTGLSKIVSWIKAGKLQKLNEIIFLSSTEMGSEYIDQLKQLGVEVDFVSPESKPSFTHAAVSGGLLEQTNPQTTAGTLKDSGAESKVEAVRSGRSGYFNT